MAIQVTYRRTRRLSMRIVKNGDECTAEPTLLCTFSVVSLFSNIIFWNHGDGSSDHLETNDYLYKLKSINNNEREFLYTNL